VLIASTFSQKKDLSRLRMERGPEGELLVAKEWLGQLDLAGRLELLHLRAGS
jgi:hypothetical protein